MSANYQKIKEGLREANRLADAGEFSEADAKIRSLFPLGCTRDDISTNITPDAMRKLRNWARNNRS